VGAYINQDPIGLIGGFNKFAYTTSPFTFTDPLGLAGDNKEVMQEKIDAVRADGTGVRLGGAKASLGSVSVKVAQGEKPLGTATQNNAAIKAGKSVASIEIGKTCTEKEISLWSTSWSWMKKKIGIGTAQGAGVSVDPVCIDPEQVAKRVAVEATNTAINNNGLLGNAVNSLNSNYSNIDRQIDAASGGPSPQDSEQEPAQQPTIDFFKK
jgi:uncharacterized protein RhaS with RHS repeats